tara:strand:- start:1270 stop:1395 length:126 start_codon:yes stop_codon:yes gene_type:complete
MMILTIYQKTFLVKVSLIIKKNNLRFISSAMRIKAQEESKK